ncbi:MAG TPA: flagellar hook-associated protein FlgL [Stellaceae bacterium]|nr:flagellar hook-associated protein FlgL [Stellaceae bacterium]
MRISTNEFLLGSLADMLAQQTTVNQLNREIASGQTMLDATADPGGAAQMVGVTNQIAHLTYDTANGQAATQTLQTGVGTLQQVTNLLVQLRQNAVAAANGTANSSDRQSLVASAQTVLQQLVQLANTQAPNGTYLFAGTTANTPAFATLASGQVVFSGDNGTNQIEIAPSLNVASTISGQNIFMNIPAGAGGVAVSAGGGNTGTAYAVVGGVTSGSQVTAASLAGTQYSVTFAAGPGNSLTYSVTSGTGAPGSAGFLASQGVVASGGYSPGSDLAFAGIDLKINGSPAPGDSFAVQPGARTSLFQNVHDLVAALQMPLGTAAQVTLSQQALQNVLANLTGAQTSVLSAQAVLGTSLSEIQSVQTQNNALASNAKIQLSNLQSANLPQVLANYSESLTALQAAQLAFAKVQNLTLFADIRP